jgi:hypothetical protein
MRDLIDCNARLQVKVHEMERDSEGKLKKVMDEQSGREA